MKSRKEKTIETSSNSDSTDLLVSDDDEAKAKAQALAKLEEEAHVERETLRQHMLNDIDKLRERHLGCIHSFCF